MIYKGLREIVGVAKGNRVVNAAYHGLVLVWSGIRSCFGSGWWVDERPWLDEDIWKD